MNCLICLIVTNCGYNPNYPSKNKMLKDLHVELHDWTMKLGTWKNSGFVNWNSYELKIPETLNLIFNSQSVLW